jgi:hypothetical protein
LRPMSTSPRHWLAKTPWVVPPWSPVSSSTGRQPLAGQRTISTAQVVASSTSRPKRARLSGVASTTGMRTRSRPSGSAGFR